jgi:hypothetical protein
MHGFTRMLSVVTTELRTAIDDGISLRKEREPRSCWLSTVVHATAVRNLLIEKTPGSPMGIVYPTQLQTCVCFRTLLFIFVDFIFHRKKVIFYRLEIVRVIRRVRFFMNIK